MRLLHQCHVPHLNPEESWTCDWCHQRWHCTRTWRGSVLGYKTTVKRTSWLRWAFGKE